MKHSVENGIRKLPRSAACDGVQGAAGGVVDDLGGEVDRDSQMTSRWSEVPLSPATGQGPGLV